MHLSELIFVALLLLVILRPSVLRKIAGRTGEVLKEIKRSFFSGLKERRNKNA